MGIWGGCAGVGAEVEMNFKVMIGEYGDNGTGVEWIRRLNGIG